MRARRTVDDLIKYAYADKIVVEIDVQASKPLCRLIGQQECGQKRDKGAGRCSGFDDTISAVDRRQRDREATQHLHQRAGAIRYTGHLVGLVLHIADALVQPAPHLVFKRKGLDHAQTL
jgi:hypothetical protein